MSQGPNGAWHPSPPRAPARAGTDRGALALAQHGHVELQLVQLGPQGLLVAPHVPELLCQAIRLLLDAQQVAGWGRRQPTLWWGQGQPSPPHLLLQEGWVQRDGRQERPTTEEPHQLMASISQGLVNV